MGNKGFNLYGKGSNMCKPTHVDKPIPFTVVNNSLRDDPIDRDTYSYLVVNKALIIYLPGEGRIIVRLDKQLIMAEDCIPNYYDVVFPLMFLGSLTKWLKPEHLPKPETSGETLAK